MTRTILSAALLLSSAFPLHASPRGFVDDAGGPSPLLHMSPSEKSEVGGDFILLSSGLLMGSVLLMKYAVNKSTNPASRRNYLGYRNTAMAVGFGAGLMLICAVAIRFG